MGSGTSDAAEDVDYRGRHGICGNDKAASRRFAGGGVWKLEKAYAEKVLAGREGGEGVVKAGGTTSVGAEMGGNGCEFCG